MTWTAEDEEEFAPVDAGEHVLTLPEEHIEGSKGPEGQPLTPEQFAARARAQDIDLDRPDVMEANGLAATSSSMPGEYGAAALDALSMLTGIHGLARQDSQMAAADRTRRRLTRTGSEVASDPLETASAAMSGATMGASDVSSSPVDDAIAVGRMLGIDIPADRERQWARDDAQARSEDWREANPHATEAAELGGSFAGMLAMPNPAPARTMGGRFLQSTAIGGGMSGLASLIDDLGHGRTDDPRAMARHALGAAALGGTMGMGAGMLGEAPGLAQRLLQRRGQSYVDHLLGALEGTALGGRALTRTWGSPEARAAHVGHIEDAGFRVGPFDTPQSMRERLGAAHDQQYALGQGIREEADAAGAGVAVDDVVQALRRRAGQAELDINDRLAGVPEALQREADEVAIQPELLQRAGRPMRRDATRAVEAPTRTGTRPAPGRAAEDVAAADEMLRRRRGAEYVEPEVTVEEPEAYSEPSVEVTAPEGPAVDAARARLQAAQQAYDAGPARTLPFVEESPDAMPRLLSRRREAMARVEAFDPERYSEGLPLVRGAHVLPPGLSPEQVHAAQLAREAQQESNRVALEPLEREYLQAQQAYNDLMNPYAGRPEVARRPTPEQARAYRERLAAEPRVASEAMSPMQRRAMRIAEEVGTSREGMAPTEIEPDTIAEPFVMEDTEIATPSTAGPYRDTAVDLPPADRRRIVEPHDTLFDLPSERNPQRRIVEPRDTVIEPAEGELSPVGDTMAEGAPQAVRDDLRQRRLEARAARPAFGPFELEDYLRGAGERAFGGGPAQVRVPARDEALRDVYGQVRDLGDEAVGRALGPERAAEFEPIRQRTRSTRIARDRAQHGSDLAALRQPTSMREMQAGRVGAALGTAVGAAIGGPVGGAVGGALGYGGARLGARALGPSALSRRAWVSRLARTVGDSSAASWASRWAPRLAQAAAAGPDALLAAHLALSQEDPEYAALADEELGPLPEYTGEEMPEDTVAESGSPESDQQGGDEEWLTTVLSAMTPEQREAFARLPLEQQQAVLMQLEESP